MKRRSWSSTKVMHYKKAGRLIQKTKTKVDLKSIQTKAVHNILADMVQVLQQLLARCHPAPSVVCLDVE